MSKEDKLLSALSTIPLEDESTSSIKEDLYTKEELINKLEDLTEKTNIENSEYEKFLRYKNKFEEQELEKFRDEYIDLYPNLMDPLFNIKIYQKKEFNNLKYQKEISDVESEGDKLCNSGFEITQHQTFVRNFLSSNTPYKNLLLYHGLGTGKTCSAINICEEMRKYMKQTGTKKKIFIIASPNVQDNFKLQLFDDRKLKKINGEWNIEGCTGNTLLNEINPTTIKNLNKEILIKMVNKLIKQYYIFMGYEKFSRYITNIKKGYDNKEERENVIKRIKKEFSNRLIVIDEVHNIRGSGTGINKNMESNFLDIVRLSTNLKLLFLSATPMYNSSREILWLLNLMNLNDKRPQIKYSTIFDSYGNLKEEGKSELIRKSRGYISFVRGENPYSFPYRIFPSLFELDKTIHSSDFIYPTKQINNSIIENPIELIDIYMNKIGENQKEVYEKTLNEVYENIDEIRNIDNEKGLGWVIMDKSLQSLNMTYPYEDDKLEYFNNYFGFKGIENTFNFNKSKKSEYEYKPNILENYGRIFEYDKIGKYSHKIKSILNKIKKSKGIVLVYSQYIDSGCIPLALALEEMGITRYGASNNLFKTSPKQVDYETLLDKEETLKIKDEFKPAKYIMITGNKSISSRNNLEIKAASSSNNVNGEEVKVILITRTGSEGIDFKFIRQIHIMDPWYNMSRNEQIIGRGIRFCSHKLLPFEERNCEIYLHTTKPETDIEPIDMYIYRLAEQKVKQIGEVSRILKENAVDCMLNIKYNNLTVEKMNQKVKINISSGLTIDYDVGDKPYTQICDYMKKCEYKCRPFIKDDKEDYKIINTTYNEDYIKFNIDVIIQKIKKLFNKKYLYKNDELFKILGKEKKYSFTQINYALDILLNNKGEYIYDILNRRGNLINIGDYYLYQPIEVKNKNISLFDRKKPIDKKLDKLELELPEDIEEDILLEEQELSSSIKIPDKTIKYINRLYDIYKSVSLSKDVSSKPSTKYEIIQLIYKNILQNSKYQTENTDILIENIKKYLLEILVDNIIYNNLIKVIEFLYNLDIANLDESIGINNFYKKMYNYIHEVYELKGRTNSGFLLQDNKGKLILFILKNKGNKYILDKQSYSNETELNLLLNTLGMIDSYNNLVYDDVELNNYISFTIENNKDEEMLFKIKILNLKRNKGVRVDQINKDKFLLFMNTIGNYINIDNLLDKKITRDNINRSMTTLRVLLEILYRHKNNVDDKVWYMPNFISKINNIEELYIEK